MKRREFIKLLVLASVSVVIGFVRFSGRKIVKAVKTVRYPGIVTALDPRTVAKPAEWAG